MADDDWIQGLRRGLREHERDRAAPARLGRYEILERLGEGATAVVYRGWDPELRRPVALKVLHASAQAAPVARERFRREAEAMAGLAHPNVVSVYDAGEENGRLYLVLELVEGRPLSDMMSPAALPLFEEIARGVGAAHARGIVHRDLKPSNVLVTPQGRPKVADFGLAHMAASPVELTRTGAVLGTPLYMAPEQIEGRGRDISPATDVYALGAMLYEAATGRPPHTGETPLEVYARAVRDDPVPPRRLNPALPAGLEAVLLKALEKDPRRRYPDAAALAEDLRRLREGAPVEARAVGFWGRLARKAVRRRAALLGAAGAALVLAAAALWGAGAADRLAERAQAEERELLLRLPEIRDPRGNVVVRAGAAAQPAGPARRLLPGEALETAAESTATLVYPDQARIDLAAHTAVRQEVRSTGADGRTLVLERGLLLVKSAPGIPGAPLRLKTAWGTFELAGGVWVAEASSGGARLDVRAGSAVVRPAGGAAAFEAATGERATIGPDRSASVEPLGEGPAAEFRRRKGADRSLVGHWKLDEGRGSVLADASGRGRAARLRGGASWASDRGRPSVRVDGRDGAIEFPGGADFDRLQDESYTLVVWYFPEAAPWEPGIEFRGAHPILMKPGWREGILYTGNRTFLMLHWTKPARWLGAFTSGEAYHPGRGYHLAGVVDRATRRTEIYVDGRLGGAVDWPEDAPSEEFGDLRWQAGHLDPPVATLQPARGFFRSVRMYARALSPAEIEILYEAER